MLEVASRIAGLHAQVLSSAELTLAARVDDLEPDAVRRALWEERSLVKTWPRGTLHLLPSDKLPLWQAARSTTRLWETGAWQRGFGVTPGELGRLNDAVAQALDSQLLTREELADRTGELTGSELLGDKLRESWGRCSSRPPPSGSSASLPAEASRSAPPAPTSKGRRLLVTIEPFAGPPPARVRRAAEAEAERLAAWSGRQLELRWADAG